MHQTDLAAEASAKMETDLSPDPFDKLTAGERRREIAAIFAAGMLGLTARPQAMPEHADSAAQGVWGPDSLETDGRGA